MKQLINIKRTANKVDKEDETFDGVGVGAGGDDFGVFNFECAWT